MTAGDLAIVASSAVIDRRYSVIRLIGGYDPFLEIRRAGSPFHDGPDSFHYFSPDTMNPVVEIYGRVAVRDNKAKLVAQENLAAGMLQHETAVLVARKLVLDPGNIEQLGSECPIGREGLQSRVHDSFAAGAMNDRSHNAKSRSEIIVDRAALSSNAAIFDVHEHVRTRLEFRDPCDVGIDVVGSRAGCRQNLHPVPVFRKQVARGDRLSQCFSGAFATSLKTCHVRNMTGIGAQTLQLEVFTARDPFGQSQCRFSGLDA